jgi:hypothetical protein
MTSGTRRSSSRLPSRGWRAHKPGSHASRHCPRAAGEQNGGRGDASVGYGASTWMPPTGDRSPFTSTAPDLITDATPQTRARHNGQSVRMGSTDYVTMPIVVRNATADDVASMQAVDVAAGQRFREIDEPIIDRAAEDQPYLM